MIDFALVSTSCSGLFASFGENTDYADITVLETKEFLLPSTFYLRAQRKMNTKDEASTDIDRNNIKRQKLLMWSLLILIHQIQT